jgi:sulfite reductase alpha subunit-like flavoprotein
MLGQMEGSGTSERSRVFRYEVVGLKQSDETEGVNYSIRSSSSTFINVPYHRMNQEMQRILRMGGKIVNITPLSAEALSPAQE